MGHKHSNHYDNNYNEKDKQDSNLNPHEENINLDSNDLENIEDSTIDSSNSVNLENLLKQKDSQIKELDEKYLRTYADFENSKKRLEREKYQSLEYANESILKDFLPILDTLESAINGIKNSQDTKESIESIENGIKLTIDNFLKALHKYGVEPIDTDGEFDPNIHNAIMQVKNESKKDGEISQIIQKGYKYKERVIRPSMVSITKNN